MKKGKLALLLIAPFLLISCTGGSEGESSSQAESTSEVDIPFIKGDNAHQSEADEAIDTIRYHYHRNDNTGDYSCYVDWDIWAWDAGNGGEGAEYTFSHYDDYGVYVDVPLSSVVVSGGTLTNMGFIVAKVPDWVKDPDGDRFMDCTGTAPGGIKDVYLVTESDKIYYDPETSTKSALASVTLSSTSDKAIVVSFSISQGVEFSFDASLLSVLVDNVIVNDYSVGAYSNASVTLTFSSSLDLSKPIKVRYRFDSSWTDERDLAILDYYDSEEFLGKYVYEGDDLGVSFDNEANPGKTTFKVWAPTSSEMTLKIYDSGTVSEDPNPSATYVMTKGEKGVYSYTHDGDLSGKYYTYEVTNAEGTSEVVDPYAKSTGVNGERGYVANFAKINSEIEGWSSDTRPDYGRGGVDASIYEIHVRDMTINPNSGVSEANRGDYLGLAEENTSYTEGGVTVSTGLAHLKELGITHVQIMPFYDYGSVDESLDDSSMSEDNYNWGYDPENYNVLEGSYSSNPYDGEVRIKEFKTMVMALHNAGISINMDVVYNHVYSLENSNFQKLVPNYYFRTDAKGSFYNGSGCGNEVASERAMMRKFIVESTSFWTEEYHLSGFRFDLMGLLDNQTMIEVYKANKAIYDKILVYGEPWTGGTSKLMQGTDADNLSGQQTIQSSLSQSYFGGEGNLVGAFSDKFRNGMKGDNNPGLGWVQGMSGKLTDLRHNVKGIFEWNRPSVDPNQVLNYVSCHDNFTLHDHLIRTLDETRDFEKAYLMSEIAVFLSQGVPFMQEGEDFLRTKAYESETGVTSYSGNSYNVGDFINDMDYSLKAENVEMFESFKSLIQLRKDHPDLRLATREEIDNQVTATADNDGNMLYSVVSADGSSHIDAYYSMTSYSVEASNAGRVVYSNTSSYPVGTAVSGGDALTLGSNEVVVIA